MRKGLTLDVRTSYDSTVVVTGDVKSSVVPAADGEGTRIKAKLKHLSRLEQAANPKAKINLAATDGFGQRATGELKLELCTTRPGYCIRRGAE